MFVVVTFHFLCACKICVVFVETKPARNYGKYFVHPRLNSKVSFCDGLPRERINHTKTITRRGKKMKIADLILTARVLTRTRNLDFGRMGAVAHHE